MGGVCVIMLRLTSHLLNPSMCVCVCARRCYHAYIISSQYIHVHVCTEREREREREKHSPALPGVGADSDEEEEERVVSSLIVLVVTVGSPKSTSVCFRSCHFKRTTDTCVSFSHTHVCADFKVHTHLRASRLRTCASERKRYPLARLELLELLQLRQHRRRRFSLLLAWMCARTRTQVHTHTQPVCRERARGRARAHKRTHKRTNEREGKRGRER